VVLRYCLLILIAASGLVGSPGWAAECTDVSRGGPIALSGKLAHREFPSSADEEFAGQRSTAESAYILQLASPKCFFGDEYLGGEVNVTEVQLIVSPEDNPELYGRLRDRIGGPVSVTGHQPFGAHTSHHHAPLVLIVDRISDDLDVPAESARRAVEGFYLALAAGDGAAAAQYIIPAKRRAGPLSAAALSSFYGDLRRPLQLLEVAELGADRYRASYRFETRSGARCEGTSVVTTADVGGASLISRIRAENGC
jgi:hypothetical protein